MTKTGFLRFALGLLAIFSVGCRHNGYSELAKSDAGTTNVLFLHHSTGGGIIEGAKGGFAHLVDSLAMEHGLNVNFADHFFPLRNRFRYLPGYGWNNYPYDYYNIWVKNGNASSYMGEPTLQVLTQYWQVIVFKHCFPVSQIEKDVEKPNLDSDKKTIGNYKLQYLALRDKLREYGNTKFVVWTGAALTQGVTNEEEAKLSREFFDWVKTDWDLPDDNIFIWDFYGVETAGGLYMRDEYARGIDNSHPNKDFAAKAAPLFANRLVDIIESQGSRTTLEGETLADSVSAIDGAH